MRFVVALVVFSIASLRLNAQADDTVGMVLDYRAVTSVVGIAPSRLQTRIFVRNSSRLPARLLYGDCSIKVRAFRSSARRGAPVWRSELSSSRFPPRRYGSCDLPTILYVYPGDSAPMVLSIPTYDVLGDTLPDGVYHFSSEFRVNGKRFYLTSGSARIQKAQDPIPDSRTFDGLRFTASVRRLRFGPPAPSVLEFRLRIENTSSTIRLFGSGYPQCAKIVEYDDRARLDSHYMRSAQEDPPRYIKTCPIAFEPTQLNPGEAREIIGTAIAPNERRHYLILVELWSRSRSGRVCLCSYFSSRDRQQQKQSGEASYFRNQQAPDHTHYYIVVRM